MRFKPICLEPKNIPHANIYASPELSETLPKPRMSLNTAMINSYRNGDSEDIQNRSMDKARTSQEQNNGNIECCPLPITLSLLPPSSAIDRHFSI